ncbi:AraC family transcriptional regulator [Chryseobacterium chendengshani]|uniref:helix-turn-helix domain-containing protein n=1 Tax=Chryseobacterium sp. LJ668 TaxID=2864040 RepID=UPI001C693775|nr:AraC family transcriptional regulator [Chryseobacterium sp. LJ668]MBW8521917.1 AraC family transcriptional regulator [Chryseobacterium sp. LJ668]QYK17573.1 AraC family transcriptional regulator [Chryseobacterium sp. LJ668]
MSIPDLFFEDDYKKFGFGHFSQDNFENVERIKTQPYIKVLYVPAGYELTVDFNHYKTEIPSLFFITYQFLDIKKGNIDEASLIYYNRDFYCIQIHDKEVACDGLLFHNVFENPKVELSGSENKIIKSLFDNIKDELQSKDSSSEEMIRTYLKQIIIRATRKWKIQNMETENLKISPHEVDVFRDFSRYLELHYREKHHVSDYADMLHIAPKTLTHKFKNLNLESPNQYIINRILLEAKRLLFYTEKTVKEIGYDLGYEDPAYFNRLFTQKVGSTPINFKKNYSAGKKSNI